MTHMYIFSKMDDYNIVDFTMSDVYWIYFFQKYFSLWSLKAYIKDMEELIDFFSEK